MRRGTLERVPQTPQNFSGNFIKMSTLVTRTFTRRRPGKANRDIRCAGHSAECPAVVFESLRDVGFLMHRDFLAEVGSSFWLSVP